jgi:hypothetical protein
VFVDIPSKILAEVATVIVRLPGTYSPVPPSMDKVNNFLHNCSFVRRTDEFDISFILNQCVVDP